ncbi:MAG: type 4a pilus biogenesis protein PilO [Desulfobulbus sp.]|jgi:Tfp pilus assembly protein PilO
MKKLTKLESFGLIAAILVSGSYFYMKKVYDPEAAALKKTITTLNARIGEYNKLQEPPNPEGMKRRLDRQRDEEKQLADTLRELGGRTEGEAEVTEVLADISLKVQGQNMQVLKMAPREKPVTTRLYTWREVDIQLRGRFYDFVVLLDRLKQMKRPVQLREMKIECDTGEYEEVLITATLRV